MQILSIGNALLDQLVRTPDESLIRRFGLEKGGMTLIQPATVKALQQAISQYEVVAAPGGSAANTAYGLARLGVGSGFIGSVGDDAMGRRFEADLHGYGVVPYLKKCPDETGHCLSVITPDAERTMGTYLGAAGHIVPADLRPELFEACDGIYFEGYLISLAETVARMKELAVRFGKGLMVDLASYTVVGQYFEAFRQLIGAGCCRLLLANEDEARVYARMAGMDIADDGWMERLLEMWGSQVETAVIKLGPRGSLVRHRGTVRQVGIFPARERVDTTGAGDLYAAGFIYGMSKDYAPEMCGYIGSIVSAHMIGHVGAKMPEEVWQQVRREIAEATADRQ